MTKIIRAILVTSKTDIGCWYQNGQNKILFHNKNNISLGQNKDLRETTNTKPFCKYFVCLFGSTQQLFGVRNIDRFAHQNITRTFGSRWFYCWHSLHIYRQGRLNRHYNVAICTWVMYDFIIKKIWQSLVTTMRRKWLVIICLTWQTRSIRHLSLDFSGHLYEIL